MAKSGKCRPCNGEGVICFWSGGFWTNVIRKTCSKCGGTGKIKR